MIRRVDAGGGDVKGLADVLIECVEAGASVGFMLPLARERAEQFWVDTIDSANRGQRIVLVATDQSSSLVVGTVQLVLATPDDQPHRGEIAKLLVRPSARRNGVAEALMRAAEQAAREVGKSLLCLDTGSVEAERLYDRLGWQRVGTIPGYALWPDGGLIDATYFYKALSSD